MSITERRPLSRALLGLAALAQLVGTVSVWSAPPPGSHQLGALGHARNHHTATLLANGNVLVFGGWYGASIAVPADVQAEVLNASFGTQWVVPLPSGMLGRWGHTATALAPGEVLILGGYDGQKALDDALLYSYDPKNPKDKGSFRLLKDAHLNLPRAGHSATRLKDKCIVVVGGREGDSTIEFVAKTPAEAKNCQRLHAAPWDSTASPRNVHTATLLRETLVLTGGGGTSLVDVYNVRTGQHTHFTSLTIGGDHQTATLLDDRHILFAGGSLYQKVATTWTENSDVRRVNELALAVPRATHFAVALEDSRVALIGGASGSGPGPWGGGCHVRLPGCIIVTPSGGACAIPCVDICNIDRDGAPTSCEVGNPVPYAHYDGAATCLRDGSVLLSGGSDTYQTGATDRISVVTLEMTQGGKALKLKCRPD